MMEDTPKCIRLPADEHLFKSRTEDTLIQPDMVAPTVEGYFRIPAIWVGEAPRPETVRVLTPRIHHERVFETNMTCGIKVQVQRDGMFLFDFTEWKPAPMVIIPGYRKPNENGPYQPTAEHQKAEELAEQYAVLRAQVMNVHQACLTSSERFVRNRSAMMGFPVTAWNTHKAIHASVEPTYYDDTEDMHQLSHNVLNKKYADLSGVNLGRRIIEIDVIEHSFGLLDEILSSDEGRLLHLVEAAYIASCRSREKRWGEALVLAWGVCEQMIASEWRKLVDAHGAKNEGSMPKDRKAKLTGRDYTASVMTEMLEIAGLISHELFRQLEIARKARNKWMHEMRLPKESEVGVCITAVESMLFSTRGIRLALQSGGRGGVPQWPYWIWKQCNP